MSPFDLDKLEKKINEHEEAMLKQDFWDDSEESSAVLQERSFLKAKVDKYKELVELFEELEVLIQLTEEEDDKSVIPEIEKGIKKFENKLKSMELEILLNDPYDNSNCIVTIHPGAGGTESQDWASILYRMYTRWVESKGYSFEVLDYLPGDDAGLKSVTFLVKGENAYGYLKVERGVHRLVRISPFDSSGRRHTSFASVDVVPEVKTEEAPEVDEKDLKIDTYRASGAGGQHVNKTDSAVRMTHLPTGIVVQCQSERSQYSNKVAAMKILQSKLFELKLREKEREIAKLRGEQKDIAWGSQIRSYVFHPYSLIKDHRTGVEVGNVDAVLDGMLNEFILTFLQQQAREKNSPN